MKRATTLLLALVMVFTLAAISPAARAEDNFGTGTIEDNVYWNETMKIGCALDETWYFYSEEEILETNGMTADMLEGKIAEMIENGGAITDMFAQNLETGATLNVVFERVSLANSLLYNEKNYIEASTATVEEALTQMGIEDVAFTVQEAEFMGETHMILQITGLYSGVPVYEQVAVVKDGRNFIVVTVFSVLEGEAEEVLSCFFNSIH